MKKEVISFYFDWREFSKEAERALKQTAKYLGGYLYRDPTCAGTDTYGFFISKEKLTRKEIRQIAKQ